MCSKAVVYCMFYGGGLLYGYGGGLLYVLRL